MTSRGLDTWEPNRPPSEPAASDGVTPVVDAPVPAAPCSPASDAAPSLPSNDSGDEAGLWVASQGGDAAARALLAERFIPYATAVAAKLYARRAHREIEFDEYRQFAMVGLMESVQRYQPDRGAKFTTFATTRIQGAIWNGIQQLSERQQQTAFRRRVLAERTESMTPAELSRDPTQKLLLDLQEIGVGVALGFLLEGTGMMLGTTEGLPDDAYASIELRRLHGHVWEMVARLPERERDIIQRHYRDGVQFEEIARALQLTKGRISQLHKQAVLRLRALVSKAESCDVTY